MPRVSKSTWTPLHLGTLHPLLPEPAEWVKVRGVMDSGAVVHAIGKKHLPTGTQIRQTEMSRQGGYYSAANGSRVYNEGVARLQGQVAGGHTVGLDWQVAKVEKPLISTHLLSQAGNTVTYTGTGGYIENDSTKDRIPFTKENGSYVLDIWVKRSGMSTPKHSPPPQKK